LTINISQRKIGKLREPFIIAELSANHNGSLERALDTISEAHRCGADAVKLQTYTADSLTIDCDRPDFRINGGLWDGCTLYNLYKEASTPYDWHQALFDHGRQLGITVFSTPFDEEAVDLLESLGTPAYKIASFEVVDLPLISYVASKRKPMIISTGLASEQEIDEAVATAREAGCDEIVLLHCISSYPAPVGQSNLRQIPELAARFGVDVGLSDHTLGTTAAVTAVALGACVIEKHFTLSRHDKGPDSEFSLEPDELRRLVTETKEAWLSLGKGGFERQPAEAANLVFRRSLYFVRDLPAGHVIGPGDIRRIRPGYGLPPKLYDSLMGRRLVEDVCRGMATMQGQFE
jgi:pseudaminic acid synthase